MLRWFFSMALGVATVHGAEHSHDSSHLQKGPASSVKFSKAKTQGYIAPFMDDDLDQEMLHTFKNLPRGVSNHLLGKNKSVKATYEQGEDHSVLTLINKFEHLFGQPSALQEEKGEEESDVMRKIELFENLFANPPTYDSSHKVTPELIHKEIRKIENKGVQLHQKKTLNKVKKMQSENCG